VKKTKLTVAEGEDPMDVEEEAPLQTEVKKDETVRAAQARENSYAYHVSKFDQIPWEEYKYSLENEEIASSLYDHLLAEDTTPIPFDEPPTRYVVAMNRATRVEGDLNVVVKQEDQEKKDLQIAAEKSGSGTGTTRLLSLDEIKRMESKLGLQTFLHQAHIVHYEDIKKIFLRPDRYESIDENKLTKYLQEIGMLVQGCWILAAEHIYQKSADSGTSTTSNQLMTARKYLFWRLSHDSLVRKAEIMKYCKISDAEATLMLEQLATKIPGKGWKLKLARDEEYLKIMAKDNAFEKWRAKSERELEKYINTHIHPGPEHTQLVKDGKPLTFEGPYVKI